MLNTSVIMPVYNAGEILRQAIDSVLRQTDPSWELICVDDGTKDRRTLEILDEYASRDDRIRIVHRENGGLFSAVQCGESFARGEFIARIDQDDLFHPELLRYCHRLCTEHSLDFLSFRYTRWNGVSEPDWDSVALDEAVSVRVWDGASEFARPDEYCTALTHVHVDSWSHYLRRELAQRAVLTNTTYLTSIFRRLHLAKRWASVLVPIYFYNTGVDSSMTHRPFALRLLVNQRADYQALIAFYRSSERASDPRGEWKTVCQCFILNQLKIFFNHQRRCRAKGLISPDAYETWMREFATALKEIFCDREVPLHWVRIRQLLCYLLILLRYRILGRRENVRG